MNRMFTDYTDSRPKIGLALGSGLARGWAHIGVIRALMKYGFTPDIIAGTSVGALVGGAYAVDRLDALEDWARSLNRLKVASYLDIKFNQGGLISGRRFAKLMRENFGTINIEDLPLKFVAAAADMITGHEVWLRSGDLVEGMSASFALPGVFPPVRNGNKLLVDGALVNPVPVSACQALGANMIIAVNLNGDIVGKARKSGQSVPTVAGFDPKLSPDNTTSAKLAKRIFKRDDNSPSLFGVMFSSLNIIQDRLARSRLAGEPPDVYIVPRIGHIGLLEFEKVDEVIRAGEQAVEAMLPQLRDAWQVLCVDNFNDDGPQP
ncbi:MAG TPA: patatin-like phospholipase family protein, partial [Alphaproteobacteria bacterium]